MTPYWDDTPQVSEERSRLWVRRMLTLVDKGVETLDEIEKATGSEHRADGDNVLELGCGTGGFLVAAGRRFERVVGIDITLRWLVVTRKRLEESGQGAALACCCAEHLPFKNDEFSLVMCEDVLEHVRDQKAILSEGSRVLRSGGVALLVTPNRFSITPEPHVGLRWVGFLPRRWMDPYVRLVKGVPYEHVRLLSFLGISRLCRLSPFSRFRIELPSITSTELGTFSAAGRLQAAVYSRLRKTRFLRILLFLFGPFFWVFLSGKDGHAR